MRNAEFEEVAALPLFAELSPEYREQLLRRALVQRVPTGVTLFEQGDPADFLYILIEGAVELRADDGAGHEALVEVVQPVDSFILAAVVTDAPLLMTARTLTRSRLLLLPAATLRSELCEQPALALMLLASLAGQYRGLVRQIKALKLRTSAERIGCYLLSLAREQGGSGTIELPYSKRALAERMGMTPENLSRAFAALRERGVRMNRSRVVIEDVDRLESFCRLDALIDGVERDLRVPGQKAGDIDTESADGRRDDDADNRSAN
jgi:CRP/FNR family transcriptional regulator, transcriptional activator FtrB